MITYYTCWLIEQRVGKTEAYEWRVVGTAETNLFTFEIIKDLDPGAKHRHPKYNRDDLYYNEKSDTLYRVGSTNHYTSCKSGAVRDQFMEDAQKELDDECPI
jgi:hypothetical protein